jgi:hypothetical protein
MRRFKKLLLFLVVLVFVFSFVPIVRADYEYSSTKLLAYYRYLGNNIYFASSSRTSTSTFGTFQNGSVILDFKDLTAGLQGNQVVFTRFATLDLDTSNFDVSTDPLNTANTGLTFVVGHQYLLTYSSNCRVKIYSGKYYTWTVSSSAVFTLGAMDNVLRSISDITTSVSAVYYSYNCTSNVGIFNFTMTNFTYYAFQLVKTSLVPSLNYVLYWSFNNSTKVLTVNFLNAIPKDVSLNLLWTVRGLNYYGSMVDVSGNTAFTITCGEEEEEVPEGALVITSPNTGDNFATLTTEIPVTVVYGGDVTSVTDPMYGRDLITVGCTKSLHSAGSFSNDDYSIVGGTTVWTGVITITEGDGAYTLLANLEGVLFSNTVSFTIGSTTGNPLLDWAKAVFEDFKKWFVDIMKFLFVPKSTDFSSLLANGWIDVHNPLPELTLQYTIDIPFGVVLGGTGVESINFKTPIVAWGGYSVVQSVLHFLLYALLIFLVWSLVT